MMTGPVRADSARAVTLATRGFLIYTRYMDESYSEKDYTVIEFKTPANIRCLPT